VFKKGKEGNLEKEKRRGKENEYSCNHITHGQCHESLIGEAGYFEISFYT